MGTSMSSKNNVGFRVAKIRKPKFGLRSTRPDNVY